VWGSGCIEPHFLDLGTIWRWVVSFTFQPLYSWGKSRRYPFDRRLGGPQSRSGQRGEEKILDPTGTRTPTPRSSSPQASRYTDYAIPAPVDLLAQFYLYDLSHLDFLPSFSLFFAFYRVVNVIQFFIWHLGAHCVKKLSNHNHRIVWDSEAIFLVGPFYLGVASPKGRSQWRRGLRHELSSPAGTLVSWVRIQLDAWMSVCLYSVFVLFCV
jgi:hypothetical protein